MTEAYHYSKSNWLHLLILFATAILLRGGAFFFYLQHEERYRQADSSDYHICALMLSHTGNMNHPETKKPIFWRTPGYPRYLSFFYSWYGLKSPLFSENSAAQKASIWFQIFLSSFIPLIVFFLALCLTHNTTLAWISGWIFALHLGFILASGYLLTDSLAMVFFFLFLLFFYQAFRFIGEIDRYPIKHMYLLLCLAALSLAIYTWMRPNGKFIAMLSIGIMLLCQCSWKKKLLKIITFGAVFFVLLLPWYIRNYEATGKWFFCPMSGPYLLSFSAPKIVRRIAQRPLDQCLKFLFSQVKTELDYRENMIALIAPHHVVPQELVCGEIAHPWIMKYPHYFMIDWMKEVCKTTFDLYSSQVVSLLNKTHTFDPIEEFLTEKLQLCLYKQPMPLLMRLIVFIEALFYLLLWIGILGGLSMFLIAPLFTRHLNEYTILWIQTGIMVGGLLFMTGGFGYARLRMPAEPLLVILSLTFWLWLISDSHKKLTS